MNAERVRELFSYDPKSGHLIRRIQTSYCVKVGDIAGSLNNKGYLLVMADLVRYQSHRLIWLYMTGKWPRDQIDHINGIRTDNRWVNLRDADGFLNAQNRRKASINSSTGVLGVFKCGKKFQASVNAGGKARYLGVFESKALAYRAYIKAKRRYHEGCTL